MSEISAYFILISSLTAFHRSRSVYGFATDVGRQEGQILCSSSWYVRELRQGEVVLRIYLPRTRVNKAASCPPSAESVKNNPLEGRPRIYLKAPIQGSGKSDCWDNHRAPKKHSMVGDSENRMRESMGSCELRSTPRLQIRHVHSREQGTGARRELEEIWLKGNLAAAKGTGRSDLGVDPVGR
jgi:hypothetical protein